jgi:glycosyltransferase involved in cell wall biosynthesis
MHQKPSALKAQAAAVRNSEHFDAEWYRTQYPDVGVLKMDPARHYLKYGAWLARDPGPGFSTRFYNDLNPDAEHEGHNPLLHMLSPEAAEERRKSDRNLIWAAARLAPSNPALALSLAKDLVSPQHAHSLEILLANAALADEAAWLTHLNRYLEHFEAAPIRLKPDGLTRFHRLACDPLPAVDAGPLVSIFMPAWNAEATLATAARSILDQTWRPLELIIVDDASTDDTWEIMQSLAAADARVRILRNSRNVGPYVSKNIALTQATGAWVTGHDADDWAHPQRLEHHLRFHQTADYPIRASDAYALRMTAAGTFGKFAQRNHLTPDGAARIPIVSCLIETEFLRNHLGYWDNVRFAGDTELIARAKFLLGAEFGHAPVLGMVCLDAPTSLTNHPDYGLWTTAGNMSPARRHYKNDWGKQHWSLNTLTAYLPFGLTSPYKAAPIMRNRPEDINAVVAGHRAAGSIVELCPSFDCDVCIVSNLRFPGGNASSTLDEVRFLTGKGLKVILVHVPKKKSSRSLPISDRYDPWLGIVKDEPRFERIRCTSLIVRSPFVACSEGFKKIQTKIEARHAYIVINNSRLRPTGASVYDVDKLLDVAESFDCDTVQICPISPVIRSELTESRFAARSARYLSSADWTPTFDLEQYELVPKAQLERPLRIGRHGRDGPEKWLKTPKELRAAYPTSPEFRIEILGGAEVAREILGTLPDNWNVLPFGSVSPKDFLRALDAFVYFPDTNLAEAFGRTIAEAMIAGLPCILPPRFRTTFGDLAFYCAPDQVRNVVARLAEDDASRVALLEFVQARVKALYASSSLAGRFPEFGLGTHGDEADAEVEMPAELARYKRLVEGA